MSKSVKRSRTGNDGAAAAGNNEELLIVTKVEDEIDWLIDGNRSTDSNLVAYKPTRVTLKNAQRRKFTQVMMNVEGYEELQEAYQKPEKNQKKPVFSLLQDRRMRVQISGSNKLYEVEGIHVLRIDSDSIEIKIIWPLKKKRSTGRQYLPEDTYEDLEKKNEELEEKNKELKKMLRKAERKIKKQEKELNRLQWELEQSDSEEATPGVSDAEEEAAEQQIPNSPRVVAPLPDRVVPAPSNQGPRTGTEHARPAPVIPDQVARPPSVVPLPAQPRSGPLVMDLPDVRPDAVAAEPEYVIVIEDEDEIIA